VKSQKEFGKVEARKGYGASCVFGFFLHTGAGGCYRIPPQLLLRTLKPAHVRSNIMSVGYPLSLSLSHTHPSPS
jgi:hypothetical protein